MQLFLVAVIHVFQEVLEGGLADTPPSLIDVVNDAVAQGIEHGLSIAAVEGGIVSLHEIQGLGAGRVHGRTITPSEPRQNAERLAHAQRARPIRSRPLEAVQNRREARRRWWCI